MSTKLLAFLTKSHPAGTRLSIPHTMSSLTHSASSLLSSFESLVAGLSEAVLATLRHVFDVVIGLLRGVVHISEEVVADTWAIIEGLVKTVFCESFVEVLDSSDWSRLPPTITRRRRCCATACRRLLSDISHHFLTANIIPILLLAFGAIVGIAVASNKSQTGAAGAAKGKGNAKRA